MVMSCKEMVSLASLDEKLEFQEFFEAFGKGEKFLQERQVKDIEVIEHLIRECYQLRRTMDIVSNIPDMVEDWICDSICANLNMLEALEIIDGDDNSLEKWLA